MMYNIIVNPASKSGGGDRSVLRALVRQLEKRDIAYSVFPTRGPGHARELAEKITARPAASVKPAVPQVSEDAGTSVLIVIGGDGTINEAINGIQDFDRVRFGFLPSGSSNDFARGLGLPDVRTAAERREMIRRLVEGTVRRSLDVGDVHLDHRTDILSRQHPEVIPDNMRFVISSGVGFDAGVCEEALRSRTKNLLNRLGFGKLTYGAIACRSLREVYSDRISCEIVADEKNRLSMDHLLFATAFNLPCEGGGYRFAPRAKGDDCRLTCVAIGDMPALKILANFPGAYRGARHYYSLPGVHHFNFRRMTVETSKPLWLHADGEVSMKTDRVTFRLLPQKLQLIV